MWNPADYGSSRKVRRLFVTLLSGLTLALAMLLIFIACRPRLLVENYPSIRRGMTQAQVEELLGGPPGNYGWYHNKIVVQTAEGTIATGVKRVWCDDGNCFEIYFDSQGNVVAHHKRGMYRQMPKNKLVARLVSIGSRIRYYVTGEKRQPPLGILRE